MNVAVVQFSPRFGDRRANLQRMDALTADVAADLVVFPELCTSGYFFTTRREAEAAAEPSDGPTARFCQRLARRLEACVVAGFAEKAPRGVFNACLVADGIRPGVRIYRKTHLFYREKECFDPGDTGFFTVDDPRRDVRLGPMICYDWRFPEAARVLALDGAQIIVCPANLVTEAWRRVMPARAVENAVFVAVANRGGSETREGETLRFKGCSAIYDPAGTALVEAAAGGEAVLTAAIDPAAARNKAFNRLNDVFRDRRPEHYGRLVESR